MKNPLAALTAALILAAPLAASAQDVPSYAAPAYSEDQQIRGRIASFDGDYSLQINDDKGYVDNVELHQGTIINPTGLDLAPGMVVSILGYNAGQVFDANEIDTPYTFSAGVPFYAGHPWDYYGPTIGLSFFFGGGGGAWWHGDAFRAGGGGYHYNAGVRIYNNNIHVRTVYQGGTFQGHRYVAPPERGGYVSHHAAQPAPQAHDEGGNHGGGGGGEHHQR